MIRVSDNNEQCKMHITGQKERNLGYILRLLFFAQVSASNLWDSVFAFMMTQFLFIYSLIYFKLNFFRTVSFIKYIYGNNKYIYWVVFYLIYSLGAQKFQCPVKNGQYEDSVQCDKYYECTDGVAKERLCPDGLVFDEGLRKVNKCDQPFNIDCGDRTELRKWTWELW